MRKYITAVLLVFSVLPGVSLWSASEDLPGWLLFEQGNANFAKKEYGKALKLYKDAISTAGIFPEAEMVIGDIYAAEGENDLAAIQYERAYNQRNTFTVPTQKYDVLYRLARLHEQQENFRSMEDALKLVLSEDRRFSDSENLRLRTQIEKNYFEKGLDQVLKLYRFETRYATSAYSKLGWFYYRTGRFSQSVILYLYAVIYRFQEISAFLSEQDSEFEFITLEDFLRDLSKNASLSSYVSGIDLFKDLYYLAGSTFALGYPKHSVQLWKLIASSKRGGRYAELSERQIKKPWIEPYIITKAKP